jgi:hypothetical protein
VTAKICEDVVVDGSNVVVVVVVDVEVFLGGAFTE